jgi:hypothetical protein
LENAADLSLLSQEEPRGAMGSLDPEVLQVFERIRTSLEEEPKHLPNWPEGVRGAPNEILRSALFTVRNRNQARQYLKDVNVVVVGEGQIRYRGEELRQDDEMVWLHLLHLAKGTALGSSVTFTPYAFLKGIGWPIKGQSYERLKTSIIRMVATAVQVSSKRLGVRLAVSMIHKFESEDSVTRVPLKRWRIWVAPEMRLLFAEDSVTRVHWEQRKTLPSGIASKLHGYWSTHQKPYPVKVETLLRLCGSEMSPKNFKQQTVEALEALVNVGFLQGWEIVNDLVTIRRA